jgi:hypothetical protein
MQKTTTDAGSVLADKSAAAPRESDRTVLIYTGYAVSALVLLGALVYHFSTQLFR